MIIEVGQAAIVTVPLPSFQLLMSRYSKQNEGNRPAPERVRWVVEGKATEAMPWRSPQLLVPGPGGSPLCKVRMGEYSFYHVVKYMGNLAKEIIPLQRKKFRH
jgi:hypothetical protein